MAKTSFHAQKVHLLINPKNNLNYFIQDFQQKNYQTIDDIELSDEKIQMIFLGIASGLSYLLIKEYNYFNFSKDLILFDENGYPKLFDYIDF